MVLISTLMDLANVIMTIMEILVQVRSNKYKTFKCFQSRKIQLIYDNLNANNKI